MKYICPECGKEHDEWPALTLISPDAYRGLTEDEKTTIAVKTDDFCMITYEDQTDRFIRVTFTQTVNDNCQGLDYGVWVSLSEKSYNDYADNYHNENHEVSYFGYLSNLIPGYEDKRSVKCTVFTRKGNARPYLVPFEDFDHPFVKDYYSGITLAEAEKRISNMIGE
ncbi:DUF2199 domain-containing protein [Mucilaginibacter sp. AW1-3]